ncbi:MAG: right-handed parallel beta-helix repeat-containing protein [Proteobacteria bacterium]|nr:right-handed parallel beta-helix repeat-containing protein [Pseudomonadota bacterium]
MICRCRKYHSRFGIALCVGLALFLSSCSDDGSKSGTSISSEVDVNDRCVDKTLKTEPGICGCQFEDKDIDGDGSIDCPVRMIPDNPLPVLQEIPGKCDEWEYPKHHVIENPVLPEYGYEVIIDTQKYNISTVYDIGKADDTTKGLNQAIKEYKEAGYNRIVIPSGHYPLTDQGIAPGSNVAIIMGPDVTFQMVPTNRGDCGLITLKGQENVYIEGGNLIGERYEHIDEKYNYECGGMQFFNSGHIFVNGVKIKSVHGDGILILDYTPTEEETIAKDIIIANSEIDDAYRNGIAVVGMDGIRISHNHIHHTNGSSPEFGIDFEPNGRSRKIFRAIVDNNTFNDNVAGDLIIYGQQTFVEHNIFDVGNLDKMIDGPFITRANTSTYIFYKNKVTKPVKNTGCSNQLFCSYGFTKGTVPDETQQKYPSFFVENDIPNQRVQLTYVNRLCIKDNVMHGGHLSASTIKNLRVINNRVEKLIDDAITGSYSFKNIYGGKAGGNVICKYDDAGQEVCTEYEKLNELNDSPKDEAWGLNTQWY